MCIYVCIHFLKIKLFEINFKINLKVTQGFGAIVQQLNTGSTLTEDPHQVAYSQL